MISRFHKTAQMDLFLGSYSIFICIMYFSVLAHICSIPKEFGKRRALARRPLVLFQVLEDLGDKSSHVVGGLLLHLPRNVSVGVQREAR